MNVEIAEIMASDKEAEEEAVQTQPVSETMDWESPTSVTMQGVPHAIASEITFGKPSVELDETKKSTAFITRGILSKESKRVTHSCNSNVSRSLTNAGFEYETPEPTRSR